MMFKNLCLYLGFSSFAVTNLVSALPGNKCYFIKSSRTRCMDISGPTHIETTICNEGNFQKWQIRNPNEENLDNVRLVNLQTGRVLDSGVITDELPPYLNQPNGGAFQEWTIKTDSDGLSTIQSVLYPDYCLTVSVGQEFDKYIIKNAKCGSEEPLDQWRLVETQCP